MFNKILIANRGEIACRIARTARRMGIQVVAVYSDADADARHTDLAQESVRIGKPASRDSYLNIDAIIDAANRTGAQAIHPGYGFLSENAEFAERCAANKITFIGPGAEAIRLMGSKSTSREIMRNAGVPVVPGYDASDQSFEVLEREAKQIGFPVLIKASAGGGGKGMRIVRKSSELKEQIEGARREAKSSFADDRLLLERYLQRPRHIEIQIFADNNQNVVHLYDRDCSIQRRYQKIIEEAPAADLDRTLRGKMTAAAIQAARAIDYVGAGTVEFIVEGDNFYFMEMNTRLQVEHPVTEMITREDLVEWQLRVAAGEPLPVKQHHLSLHGHAIEARIYAEDPSRDFLPVTGQLNYVNFAEGDLDVRIDTGVRRGDEIGIHYDPLIAKIIVWDEDREQAVARLTRALSTTKLTGITTNLAFLNQVIREPKFLQGPVHTNFIESNLDRLVGNTTTLSNRTLAMFALAELVRRAEQARKRAAESADQWSPWALTGNWRLNMEYVTRLRFGRPDDMVEINAYDDNHGIRLVLPDGELLASDLRADDQRVSAELDGHRVAATVIHDEQAWTIFLENRQYRLEHYRPATATGTDGVPSDGKLVAPMPGTITFTTPKRGADVKSGDVIVVLEAMKMEHSIVAPFDGVLKDLRVAVGDIVRDGAQLATVVKADKES